MTQTQILQMMALNIKSLLQITKALSAEAEHSRKDNRKKRKMSF